MGSTMSDSAEVAVEYPAEQTSAPAVVPPLRYDKVGGWLLFLCISLTILNPITLIGVRVYNFLPVIPVLDQVPSFVITSIVDGLLTVLVAGFSLYAGVSLWARRPGSVRLAKTFLYVGAAFTLLSPFLPLAAGLGSEFNKVVLDSALQSWRGILYFALWLNYLRQSKRVKATVGLQDSVV